MDSVRCKTRSTECSIRYLTPAPSPRAQKRRPVVQVSIRGGTIDGSWANSMMKTFLVLTPGSHEGRFPRKLCIGKVVMQPWAFLEPINQTATVYRVRALYNCGVERICITSMSSRPIAKCFWSLDAWYWRGPDCYQRFTEELLSALLLSTSGYYHAGQGFAISINFIWIGFCLRFSARFTNFVDSPNVLCNIFRLQQHLLWAYGYCIKTTE